MSRRKFVIYAYSFDDTSGGIIALHLLCRRLREAGEEAVIWQAGRPPRTARLPMVAWLRTIRYRLRGMDRNYSTGPFENPLGRPSDLDDAIVVYPEVVAGNPLRAKRVVRWLLHRPGFHTGKIAYGQHDLFFHYQDAFREGLPAHSERLMLGWWNDAYKDLGQGGRSGSTYLMRKGEGRELVHDLTNSVRVDDMTHEERAAAFNKAEYTFSYDPYTFYSLYAAICGCISVIVPQDGVSKEEWLPDEPDRYGLAYGMEDVGWAVQTRPDLIRRMEDGRREEDAMLRNFVHTCQAAF